MKKLLKRLRALFELEWTWRLFVVLQIVGILGIIYLDITYRNNWNFLPEVKCCWGRFPYGKIEWDLINPSSYVTRHGVSLLAYFFLFGPFAFSKAVDWITSAKPSK